LTFAEIEYFPVYLISSEDFVLDKEFAIVLDLHDFAVVGVLTISTLDPVEIKILTLDPLT
jgi:hypothetical protein